MKLIFIIFFLCLTSCKTTDYNPLTSVLRYTITNAGK